MPQVPKFDPARHYRGRGPTQLPAAGRPGKPPQWPLPGKQTPAEVAVWAQLWATPQAVAWERLGAGCARIVARYARLLIRAEDADAPATIQLSAVALEDRLALSPKSMRLMLWEVVSDEVAEKRDERTSARGRILASDRMKSVDPA